MQVTEQQKQFLRFLIVGGLNTLVCLAVIFLCKSIIGLNPYVSNAIGYVAGVINSFLWNRTWVFESHGNFIKEALKFAIGFGLCYGIQFLFFWGTIQFSPLAAMEWKIMGFTLSGYGVAYLAGMCVYTLCNFIYNRAIAFRK